MLRLFILLLLAGFIYAEDPFSDPSYSHASNYDGPGYASVMLPTGTNTLHFVKNLQYASITVTLNRGVNPSKLVRLE